MEPNKLTEVFNVLQKDGINARIKHQNQTLLIWATSEGYSDIAFALIDAKANLNDVNAHGNTALIRAACENRIDIAQALIEAGAKLDVQNEAGYTALILAKRRGNMEIYSLLLNSGANATLETNQGITVQTEEQGTSPKTSLTAPRNQKLELKIIQKIKIV